MAFALHSLFLLCGISGLLTGVWAFPSKISNGLFCPKGWTLLDCNCYVYQEEQRTFADAEAVCNILGGNLVSIHSGLENAVVQQLIVAGTNNDNEAWIGLHDSILNDDYIWTDGTVADFLNFATGEPNAANGNCVALDEMNGEWNCHFARTND
ncbi:lithostathine-1-beta-like isoform X2 [Hippocampus zosterae]|uniref:lithostathine-1-beta-like isoform X2 n=1 Tax=Hippocampus zosterae TaxID=109293 RepID=UPI00223C9759|nr:lithostathine-1-beta-like isoform X2 [Hippocampus zosterae]